MRLFFNLRTFYSLLLVLGITTTVLAFAGKGDHEKKQPTAHPDTYVIEIDETKATPEQRKIIAEALTADPQNESNPVQPIPALKLRSFINVINDLGSIGGASLFIASFASHNSKLGEIGAGIFTVNYFIEYFRSFENRVAALTDRFLRSLNSVSQVCDSFGHAVAITGLGMLASGENEEIGGWITTAGFLIKLGAHLEQLHSHGIKKTFGPNVSKAGIAARLIFLTAGGTAGGIILSTSGSQKDPELAAIGGYILGSSVLAGSAEILFEDIEALYKLYKKEPKPIPTTAP